MRYVIIRDDDTNASTPAECLERLYGPALKRGLPINLATIPEVSLSACQENGSPEGFLKFKNGHTESVLPLGSNPKLVEYLRENPGFEILQHGLHHEYLEFERLAGGLKKRQARAVVHREKGVEPAALVDLERADQAEAEEILVKPPRFFRVPAAIRVVM